MSPELRERRSERFVLAIDLGSGALKVGSVSLDGRLHRTTQRDLVTDRLPGGGAVQDAGGWWQAVRQLAEEALAGVPREHVLAVSCTGQWASTIPVAESGEPVGPCVMWLDTRGAKHSREVIGGPLLGYSPAALATWIRHTGGVPSPFGGDPVGHMLHLERDEPGVAAAARWYMEPVDYLSMRFTGRAVASYASMSAAWLTDNRRLDRLEYDPALVRRTGLDARKLPPLVETGSLVGPVRAEVADDLGTNPKAQVVTGIPDLHSAAFGCGAIAEGEPHITISTTSWISLPFRRKKTDVTRSIATVPGLDSKSYLVANNHEAAGLCLRWLRDSFTTGEQASFERLVQLAESSPPGSGGILFTPWLAGERSPVDDRHARGGWHNLSLHTGNADLIRSVLEGVAYNSRWLNEAVEHFAKRRLDPLRIFGGGAIPELWCQVHADVMNRRIERVADPMHANLRGAALFAAVALGAVSREEVRSLVPVERVFTPDPANRAVYDRLYEEFPGLYKAQRKMFARLNGGRT